jgi:hypothetical protein
MKVAEQGEDLAGCLDVMDAQEMRSPVEGPGV